MNSPCPGFITCTRTRAATPDIEIFKDVETGLGANICAYAIPPALQTTYGQHPHGINVYLRLRLK